MTNGHMFDLRLITHGMRLVGGLGLWWSLPHSLKISWDRFDPPRSGKRLFGASPDRVPRDGFPGFTGPRTQTELPGEHLEGGRQYGHGHAFVSAG